MPTQRFSSVTMSFCVLFALVACFVISFSFTVHTTVFAWVSHSNSFYLTRPFVHPSIHPSIHPFYNFAISSLTILFSIQFFFFYPCKSRLHSENTMPVCPKTTGRRENVRLYSPKSSPVVATSTWT